MEVPEARRRLLLSVISHNAPAVYGVAFLWNDASPNKGFAQATTKRKQSC